MNTERAKEFKKLIQEIHRVNDGWHSLETANRWLESSNKELQYYYLRQKNTLQQKLRRDFSEYIEIVPNQNNFYSIKIKNAFQFSVNNPLPKLYRDACHTTIIQVEKVDYE